MRSAAAVATGVLALVAGCSTADVRAGAGGPDAGGAPDAGDGGAADSGTVEASHAPAPIIGGTLLVTADREWAVAADPDVDAVFGVALGRTVTGCESCAPTRVAWTVRLPPGEEPGRLVEDASGRVHVVLRHGGAMATIQVATGRLLARRLVCPEPRGIAYDPGLDRLHVACASGDLVTLSPASGAVDRRVHLDVDLRDVVVVPDGLVVSRFKTAELLRVDTSGALVERVRPSRVLRGPLDLSTPVNDPLEPAVAWRTVADATGRVFMLHQYGLDRPIDVQPHDGGAATAPYATGSLSPCGGIVDPVVSTLPASGALDMGFPVPGRALSVDLAATMDGSWIAIAHAGAREDRVSVFRAEQLASLGRSPMRCAEPEGRLIVEGVPVAVAMFPGAEPSASAEETFLVVQTRMPSALRFYSGFATARTVTEFAVRGTRNGGHALFHRDSGGGIACAQCHPEGGEDGRVWQFTPTGPRRTPALHVGLAGTEPLHWSGDLPTFDALIDDTFVRRMGGEPPVAAIRTELQDWVYGLQAPDPIVDPGSEAALRGRTLFESDALACKGCHDGARVARSSNVDVGVASPEAFQVPALRGVGYRAPFLHAGCARTLRERFDPACGGGDLHGHTSALSEAELSDLIAYLESL